MSSSNIRLAILKACDENSVEEIKRVIEKYRFLENDEIKGHALRHAFNAHAYDVLEYLITNEQELQAGFVQAVLKSDEKLFDFFLNKANKEKVMVINIESIEAVFSKHILNTLLKEKQSHFGKKNALNYINNILLNASKSYNIEKSCPQIKFLLSHEIFKSQSSDFKATVFRNCLLNLYVNNYHNQLKEILIEFHDDFKLPTEHPPVYNDFIDLVESIKSKVNLLEKLEKNIPDKEVHGKNVKI